MTTLKLCCFFSRIVVILPQSNLHTRFFHLFKNFDVMMIFSFQSYGLSLIDDDIFIYINLLFWHTLSMFYFLLSTSSFPFLTPFNPPQLALLALTTASLETTGLMLPWAPLLLLFIVELPALQIFKSPHFLGY